MISLVYNKAFINGLGVAFPPTVSPNARALLHTELKYPPASLGTPGGFMLQIEGQGGAGDPGQNSGQILASQFTRQCDGSEGGMSFDVLTDGGVNALGACLDIFQSDIPGATIDLQTAIAYDSTPGKPWRAEFGSDLDVQAGDLLVVHSTTNQNTGPNRSAHQFVVAGLGPAIEFRDGGFNVGHGLGACTVLFPVEAPLRLAYVNTANVTYANGPCGVTILSVLREVVP